MSELQTGFSQCVFVSFGFTESVSFKMSEKCGGALKIKYQKEPEDVCHFNVSNELKNKLCQDLKCGLFKEIQPRKIQVNLQVFVNFWTGF